MRSRTKLERSHSDPLRADVQSITDCDGEVLGPFKAPFPDTVRAIEQKEDIHGR